MLAKTGCVGVKCISIYAAQSSSMGCNAGNNILYTCVNVTKSTQRLQKELNTGVIWLNYQRLVNVCLWLFRCIVAELVHEWMVSLKLLYSSTYVAEDWLGCIAYWSDLPVNFYISCVKMFRAYCVPQIWLIILLIYTKMF